MLRKNILLFFISIIIIIPAISSCKKSETSQQTSTLTVTGVVQTSSASTNSASTTTAVEPTTVITTATSNLVKNSAGKMAEKPQYGGSATVIWSASSATKLWDPVISVESQWACSFIYDTLGKADWSKGPQGTNQYGFETGYVPDAYLMGSIAESWERPDNRSIILHIRKGIRFQNKAPMNGREVTADDVLYSVTRNMSDPRNPWYIDPKTPNELKNKVIVLDKYTVQITYPDPSSRLIHDTTQWIVLQPKEAIQQFGNLDDWKNAVGTGPFIALDCVADSSVLFQRNPNYWMKDPLFPENQLPYVDRVQAIVIQDSATQLAALRSHKVDTYSIPWDKVESVRKTNPEINVRKLPADTAWVMFMRTDIAPFKDKRVRQALQYAVDEPGIANKFYRGDAIILGWPVQPFFSDNYTPLEQLPLDLREMFEYKPDFAKKLLAEAGYPNGFTTEVAVPASFPEWVDVMAVVKENFAAAGVKLEIKTYELSSFLSVYYDKSYPGMAYAYWGNNSIDAAFGWAHGGWVGKDGSMSMSSFSKVTDPIAEAAYRKLMETASTEEQEKLRKEENVREIDMAWEVCLPIPSVYMSWQPWIKGYAGEQGIGPGVPQSMGIFHYIWIDNALKEKYTRSK